ncbi:hypothetical protein OCU04_000923 [Sclerotinia nivalis]|uniref:Uncharacterized protein n=1 Tax=Sclerotinia nivalis TaxID=352851 RepID=A0A9X0DP87_9HELO|nr:hypothetical protein OCU04_000923 [Sclerotinia nivalis]
MATSINRQNAPGQYGVKDKRFQLPQMSGAGRALELFKSGDDDFRSAASLYERCCNEGTRMTHEYSHELRKVILTTPSQTQNNKFMRKFRKVHALFLDESGLLTIVDLIMLLATFDVEQLVILGDVKQLTPQAPLLALGQGLARETAQNAITYFTTNHWPSVILNTQRRGIKEIIEIPSQLFYRGQIKDADSPEKEFPMNDAVKNALRKVFPNQTISKPYLFIEAINTGEIMDESHFSSCQCESDRILRHQVWYSSTIHRRYISLHGAIKSL